MAERVHRNGRPAPKYLFLKETQPFKSAARDSTASAVSIETNIGLPRGSNEGVPAEKSHRLSLGVRANMRSGVEIEQKHANTEVRREGIVDSISRLLSQGTMDTRLTTGCDAPLALA